MSLLSGSSKALVKPPDPEYITYLLDPEEEYNCYFIVGNPTLNIPKERIGVVKKMLLAHSLVLRTELQDSTLAEKGDVTVTDMYPDTFKNLLRYTYGYDNTAELDFDEADNLLYAAEKYMMITLKDKLTARLMMLINYENICSLMNNPACFKVLELNAAISQILQLETSRILTNPQFLSFCPDALLNILQQDVLDVNEIELWRSAVKWAKNRANCEDGVSLRNELTPHLLHIRVCTLSYEELCTEVRPTKVLTDDEFEKVCLSHKSGEIEPSLTTVCHVVEQRLKPIIKTDLYIADFSLANRVFTPNVDLRESVMLLEVKQRDLEICFVELSDHRSRPHRCSGSITFDDNSGGRITVSLNEILNNFFGWRIPSKTCGMRVCLASRRKYSLKTTFTCGHVHATFNTDARSFTNRHMTVEFHNNPQGVSVFHMLRIKYKTVKRKIKPTQSKENQGMHPI